MGTRPFWLMAEQRCNELEVFTIGSNVLPVFSFREEAEMFLRFGVPEKKGWPVSETTREELASVLYGPCREVTHVALDPVLGLVEFASLSREHFMRVFLSKFMPPSVEAVGVAS